MEGPSVSIGTSSFVVSVAVHSHATPADLAAALLEQLPGLNESISKLIALHLLGNSHAGALERLVVALTVEQHPQVDPARNILHLLRLARCNIDRSESIFGDLDLKALDVHAPLLTLMLGPLPGEALAQRIEFKNECQGPETAVEVFDVIVAAAEEPVQVVEGADADVELGDEALASRREEAHTAVGGWRQFSRRPDNVEVVSSAFASAWTSLLASRMLMLVLAKQEKPMLWPSTMTCARLDAIPGMSTRSSGWTEGSLVPWEPVCF
jgi:hypothetical protein